MPPNKSAETSQEAVEQEWAAAVDRALQDEGIARSLIRNGLSHDEVRDLALKRLREASTGEQRLWHDLIALSITASEGKDTVLAGEDASSQKAPDEAPSSGDVDTRVSGSPVGKARPSAAEQGQASREKRPGGETRDASPRRPSRRKIAAAPRALSSIPPKVFLWGCGILGFGAIVWTLAALPIGLWERMAVAFVEFVGVSGLMVLIRQRFWRAEILEVDAQKDLVNRRDRLRGQLDRTVIWPLLRGIINELRTTRFTPFLDPDDVGGLADLFDDEYEVPTASTSRLAKTLSALRAGNLGIYGPRGAGKTTLIKAACQGRLRDWTHRRSVGVVVPAPVRYEAAEFIPYLFGRLCVEVLGETLTTERKEQARRAYQQEVMRLGGVLASLIAVASGAVATAQGWDGRSLTPPTLVAAVGIVYATAAFLSSSFLSIHRRVRSKAADPLLDEARRNLEALRYLETRSEEWSSEVSAARAAKLARKEGRSLAAQALTLPELTTRYADFLAVLTKNGGRVVIGIDELDKMQSASDANRFLNDIKAVFSQPNVFYLVSLSEEAAASFEARDAGVREVFESVFDTVVPVEPLTFDDARGLLERRVIGLSPPFDALCYVMSGGLPRELIRVARESVNLAQTATRPHIRVVVSQLIAQRNTERQRAAEAVTARYLSPHGVQPFLGWLRDMDPEATSDVLLERAQVAPIVNRARTGGVLPDELELLAAGLAAWWHYAGTTLEFFAGIDEQQNAESRRPEPSGGNGAGTSSEPSPIDLLARGYLDMGICPELSWRTVNAFRRRVGRDEPPYPLPSVSEMKSDGDSTEAIPAATPP